MKKIIFAISAVVMSLSLTSCAFGGVGSTAAPGAPAASQTSQTSQTSQGGSSIMQNVLGAVGNTNTLDHLLGGILGNIPLTEADLQGAWVYQGPAVAFESENFLAQAGGSVAAGTIETKIDEQLNKYGIKAGTVKITLNPGHTFSAQFGNYPLPGTWTYDPQTRQLTMSAALGLFNQTATVGRTTKGICLLFPADKLLSLMTTVGGMMGNSTTATTATALLKQYKGMQVGLKMEK